ncbi:MAG: acyl carrier protein [Lachnospiraceae bacterium]|nr:acyl carrier protein [Lachnospiraceae bacterium]
MELEVLRKVISEILNVDPREITEESTFLNDLGADSLDVFQMVLRLEDELDISLDPDKVQAVTTVGEAIKLIRETKEEQADE